MFDSVNLSFFEALNAPAEPGAGMLLFAQFSAEYLMYLMALAMLAGWFAGGQKMRRALIVAGLTVIVGLGLNRLIGLFIYHSRPFEIGVGHQFLPHVIENSFPSDHGTLVFSVAMGLLFSYGGKVWGGCLCRRADCRMVPCLSGGALAIGYGRFTGCFGSFGIVCFDGAGACGGRD